MSKQEDKPRSPLDDGHPFMVALRNASAVEMTDEDRAAIAAAEKDTGEPIPGHVVTAEIEARRSKETEAKRVADGIASAARRW